MNEFQKLLNYLLKKISTLNAKPDQSWQVLCVRLIRRLESTFLEQMYMAIQMYIHKADVIQRIKACELSAPKEAELVLIFKTVAQNYIFTPVETPPQKFTRLLEQTLFAAPIFTVAEVTKILDALNLRNIDIYIENRSLTHDKSEADLLLLLKNSIWIADRLANEQQSDSFQYPNIAQVEEALQYLNKGGIPNSGITAALIDDLIANMRTDPDSTAVDKTEADQILTDLIRCLEQPLQSNKRVRNLDAEGISIKQQHAELLESLRELKATNKPLNMLALQDIKALQSIVDLHVPKPLASKILTIQYSIRKEFRKGAGLNGIKQLLTISGCTNWEQLAKDPKLFFSQITPQLLFYVTVILASKAAEDQSLPLNYLTKELGIYRPEGDPEYPIYRNYVRQLTALEKFIVILLKHDLSLDRDKMSKPTKEFFETMGYMPHNSRLRLI